MTARRARPPRPGRFILAEIEAEWHVLYAPDDLPHHFLSVARFQDRSRAKTYAEIEDCWADEGPPHADASSAAPVAAPPAPRLDTPNASAAQPAEEPARSDPAPDPISPPSAGGGTSAPQPPSAELPETAPPPVPVEEKPAPNPPVLSVMAANREKVLNHYAEHGGSIADIARKTGVASTSTHMAAARREGDPRIAAGDAKRHPMPVAAARAIEQAQKARAPEASEPAPTRTAPMQTRPVSQPAIAPLPDGRKRTHAEMVEAAKRAVPAPSFGERRGVTCRTG